MSEQFKKLQDETVKIALRLEEAIKIIMHEWGYSREQTIEWLDRKVEGED